VLAFGIAGGIAFAQSSHHHHGGQASAPMDMQKAMAEM
jgi:hypothetical protein